ncbi:MAG TPA: hypothetical protein VNW50_22670 [Streptosporangiaceae bacterium]|nr:hypothetical protein [Streptosporangiaceae bacterium]
MTTARVFRSAAAGLCTLGLALTVWAAGPAAQAAQRSVAARPAGPASQTAQVQLAAKTSTYKYTLSRITSTGSRLAIAATDSHGDLYFFWQRIGTTAWHKQLVGNGGHGQAYSKPSVAWTGSAVVIVTLDHSGDLVAYTQHGGSWKRKVVARASGHKFQAPSVAAVPGGPVLIAAARAGQMVSFELAPGHSNWSRQTAGYGTFGTPSIITCYDSLISQHLALITATSGGTLDFWWERLDNVGWHQETVATPGPSGSYAGPSLTATASELMIAAATTGGTVDTWSQSIGGSGWSEQTVATAGSSRYSRPAITWTGPVLGGPSSYFVITAASQTGKLAFWWQLVGSTSWNPETVASAGKHASYASPAISVTSKSVVITAINTKPGDVYFWYQKFTTNPWHRQLVATG